MMNHSVLKSLVGRKVSIFSILGQSSAKDDGVIRNVDDQCIVLEKGSETLVFVIMNVRLVKVIE